MILISPPVRFKVEIEMSYSTPRLRTSSFIVMVLGVMVLDSSILTAKLLGFYVLGLRTDMPRHTDMSNFGPIWITDMNDRYE